MKIKVCGMRNPENIAQVAALEPDYMGFIFYKRSPRYAASLDPDILDTTLPSSVRRAGVFVDAPLSEMLRTAERYKLNTLQLHGAEPPQTCAKLRKAGFEIVKAFGVERGADLLKTVHYESCCDLFLFDTRTPGHGGSGNRFDWRILDAYGGRTPFLLSGGISALDAENILSLYHPSLYGADLNSRFEIEAGLKNTELLERFIKTIRS
ncbi:MAG: phosphoribosylanthranilate isomerase [Rikenellaceae bacterium]|nr:phosphoribosylanthranilate isomerase [Rikenellaceae bacterium]